MNGVNTVHLLGNLGADPELRQTTGSAVLRMRLATTETWLDAQRVRQESTEWHTVAIWGKRAEALAKILTKGSRIYVQGSLRSSSYDDRDGVRRVSTEVHAKELVLCDGRRDTSEPERRYD